MATIEKYYLPPLNPGTSLTEADRSKVYEIIRRHLSDVLTGDQSYYRDGVQKDMQERTDDLRRFFDSVQMLQGHVNDPSNLLRSVVKDLKDFADAFVAQNAADAANESVDPIEIPRSSSPNTNDRNDIYIPPVPGPFEPKYPWTPPWSPELQPTFRGASFSSSPGLEPDNGQTIRLVSSPLSHSRSQAEAAPAQLQNDDLSDFNRNNPAWLLQLRRQSSGFAIGAHALERDVVAP